MYLKTLGFILSVFLFVTVSSTEINCEREDIGAQCEYPELFSSIPNTIEEYNVACPKFKNYAKCLKELDDKCLSEKGLAYFATEEMYESVYGVASDMCEEDTLIYEVITENLRCLNETFENSPCYDEIEAITNEFKIYLPNATDENDYDLPAEIYCLQEAISSVCYTNDIDKNCGTLAADMAKEFVRRSYLLSFSCDNTDAKVLLADVGRYKLKSHQQDYLVEVLGEIINRYDDE
ncbi:uncharacterized protein CEXT_292951 [Caerostris extrusa]|uniref:Uncharacterized protein n=1 Tax=Caerostris extrusa TaxID=172846 RepID=A0AAV4XZX7_CAEEX|nr:uncharacterized protein CEXT_292951 [Caerostris extrusa]